MSTPKFWTIDQRKIFVRGLDAALEIFVQLNFI